MTKTTTTGLSIIAIKRPKWKDVYAGYPKNLAGDDDMDAPSVFRSVLGDKYYIKHQSIFSNACATRVSLGLLEGGMAMKREFNIINPTHKHKGKGFTASAINLKNWLSRNDVFGKADEEITGPTDISKIAKKINNRNGIYIIIPKKGYFVTASGHATLWVGANNDVIGGHNYGDGAGTIYFWELK